MSPTTRDCVAPHLLRALCHFVLAVGFTTLLCAQAPVITVISPPRQVVNIGQNLTLSVSLAPGTAGESYQWKRSGRPISGATTASYTITGANAVRDNGWYQVVVSNSSGDTTSAVVFVNVVVTPAQILGFGDNSEGETTIPAGLTSVAAIVATSRSNFALKADGTIVGWGRNTAGQTSIPAGISDVVAIAAGYEHTVVLKSNGTLQAWGRNDDRQTVIPTGLGNVVAIDAGGYHTIALKSDGSVVAWGHAFANETTVPAGLGSIVAVAAGYDFNLVLRSDGTVTGWGANNSAGTIVPAGLNNVVSIDAGELHGLALKADGTVATWGYNFNGQATVPAGLANVVAINAGTLLNFALKADGTVIGWVRTASFTPNFPAYLDHVVGIAGGFNHALVLRDASADRPPVVTIAPAAKTAVEGELVMYFATVSGTPPFTYQWRKNGVPIAGEDGAGLNVLGARPADAGDYTVAVTNSIATVVSAPSTLVVRPANGGRLANLSIRGSTGGGNGALIVGFVLAGGTTFVTSPSQPLVPIPPTTSLLIRASGPALGQFGIANVLPDPMLTLYSGDRVAASNDNWGGATALVTAASNVGAFAFPAGSRDAGVVMNLTRGSFTAQVSDAGGGAGIALLEIYDTTPLPLTFNLPRLVNVSARANVGFGGDIMIAGFLVKGETSVRVLVRAVGPALTDFGVTGALANPRLELFRDATLIQANDDWSSPAGAPLAATFVSVGAFPLPADSKDSAIVATLSPGSYTAQVSGVGNTVGVALIEVYEAP